MQNELWNASLMRSEVITKLEKRINKSRKAIQEYPQWVRQTMKFQGGGVQREKKKEK